jgi:flagellar hook-length control protein FliK
VSSTASNVSATPAVQSSSWPQTPAATPDSQDNNGRPFAALLDAAAAPDKTNAQPAAAKTAAAADQPAAKFTFGPLHPAGATDQSQNTTPDAKTAASATNSANVTGSADANSTATANPSTTASATAAQPGAIGPADIAGVGVAFSVFANAALTIAADASGNAGAPQQTTKTPSDNGKGNADDTSAASNAGTAATTDPQGQPIAAFMVANAIVNTPPAASNAAPGTTLGGSAMVGAKAALPFADTAAVAPGQDANNAAGNAATAAAPAQQTGGASSAQIAGNTAAAQNANPPAPTASNAAASQGGQIATAAQDGNTVVAGQNTKQDTKLAAPARDAALAATTPDIKVSVPAQTAKLAAPAGTEATATTKQSATPTGGDPTVSAANADAGTPADAMDSETWNGNAEPQTAARVGSSAPRLDAPAATDAGGSSSAQSGWNAAKAVTEGLPNFGFAAATPTASVATAAMPGTAAAAAVPVAGLAVAIAARAQAGSSQFDIRLDPPELGRIDVRLDVDRNGQVTSHVTVDRADTLQLLQSQQPQLERALEQAGLKTADNGLQFTLRDQSFSGQNGNGGTPSSPTWLVIPDADQPAIPTTHIYSRAGLGSGVDIRV